MDNMADVELVLSNPLCFLVNKFGKEQVKLIKNVLVDFYSAEELIIAKQQLLSDIEKVNVGITFPHIPQQRQGENRAVRTVDDMVTYLTLLDEHKSLNILPSYVADAPDRMPSLRLYEGDFGVLLAMLEKMSDRLVTYGSAITAIARDVHALQAVVRPPESSAANGVSLAPPRQRQPQIQPQSNASTKPVNNLASQSGQSSSQSADQSAGVSMTVGNSDASSSSIICNNNIDPLLQPTLPPNTVWASMVSTPVIHDNRFGVLTTDDDGDGGTFIEQRSSRVARNKRRRQLSTLQQQPASRQHQTSTRSSRPKVMIGKSSAADASVAAARKFIKKSVFCIDNVSVSHAAEDIRSFVSSMAIDVVSCFEVKPRRRRSDDDATDRKAFRLCISADDQERLLDPSKWPDSIAISEWFFKDPKQGDKRQRLDNQTSDRASVGGDVIGGGGVAGSSTDMDHADGDQTVLLDTTVINACTQDG